MAKTDTVRARMEADLKADAEAVLSAIGLSTTDAITMFFRQVVMQRGLPFDAKIPNAETLAAFEEAKDPANLTRYADVKTAIADMLAKPDDEGECELLGPDF